MDKSIRDSAVSQGVGGIRERMLNLPHLPRADCFIQRQRYRPCRRVAVLRQVCDHLEKITAWGGSTPKSIRRTLRVILGASAGCQCWSESLNEYHSVMKGSGGGGEGDRSIPFPELLRDGKIMVYLGCAKRCHMIRI